MSTPQPRQILPRVSLPIRSSLALLLSTAAQLDHTPLPHTSTHAAFLRRVHERHHRERDRRRLLARRGRPACERERERPLRALDVLRPQRAHLSLSCPADHRARAERPREAPPAPAPAPPSRGNVHLVLAQRLGRAGFVAARGQRDGEGDVPELLFRAERAGARWGRRAHNVSGADPALESGLMAGKRGGMGRSNAAYDMKSLGRHIEAVS